MDSIVSSNNNQLPQIGGLRNSQVVSMSLTGQKDPDGLPRNSSVKNKESSKFIFPNRGRILGRSRDPPMFGLGIVD